MDEIFWAFSIITEPFVTVLRSEFLERLQRKYYYYWERKFRRKVVKLPLRL